MILKQKLNYSWNRKHKCNVMFVMLVIVGCIWRKPVSTYAISVLIGGFGEQSYTTLSSVSTDNLGM